MSTSREPRCSNEHPWWEERRRGSRKPSRGKLNAFSLMLCTPVPGKKGLSNLHAMPSNWIPLGCPRRGQGATKRVSFFLTASRARLVVPGWALPASAHPVERKPVWLRLPALPPTPELCGLC